MEDDYDLFLEQIRQLKENHVIMKGHEKSHSKRFKTIGDMLKKSLMKTEAVRD